MNPSPKLIIFNILSPNDVMKSGNDNIQGQSGFYPYKKNSCTMVPDWPPVLDHIKLHA